MPKICKLGACALALAGVACALPSRVGIGFVPVPTVFPITNATITSKPTPTDTNPTCEASCEVRYPELFGISWAREDQIVFTETVTVGTVTIATSTIDSNTLTRTYTYYDVDVPRFYNLYQQSTDEAGTKIVEATITLSDGTIPATFAYPTPWVDYPSAYHWQGILPTHDEKYEPVCATSTEELAFGEVTPHPLYPQPTDVIADKEDPKGTNYVPLLIALQDLPDEKWFNNAFPSESAYAYCTPVPGKPAPVEISTAKFVLATYSFITSIKKPGVVHQESTATDWGETTTDGPPDLIQSTERPGTAHMESSVSRDFPTAPPPTKTSLQVPDIPDIPSSLPPGNPGPSVRPSAPLVHNPTTAPTPGNGNGAGQPAPSNNNGAGRPTPVVANLGSHPAPAPTTPIFTFVPTTINDHPTATPVFIFPGSSSTATVGQTVTLDDGQTTVLVPPSAIFAFVPTTINGVATSAPAFIISGTSTASIGQTITLDGQSTVLAAPAPFATEIPTTIFGIETHVTAFIISGSITAFPGQTITLDGQTTALPTADAVFTTITTTGSDGKETTLPAYIVSGSETATIGQTVTIDGTATVLSLPTADAAFTSITTVIDGRSTVIPVYIIGGSTTATLGQTVTIDGKTTVLSTPTGTGASAASYPANVEGQPKETGSTKGSALRRSNMRWSALFFGFGTFIIVSL